MGRYWVVLALAFTLSVPCAIAQASNENTATTAQSKRNIPDDNLAYPVLINLTDCTSNIPAIKASGFYLDTGSEQYLVTARHVLFNEAERVQPGSSRPIQCNTATLSSYSKDPKERQQNQLRLDLKALNNAGMLKRHATHDVVVVQIAKNSSPGRMAPVPGVQPISVAPTGFLSVNINNVQKLEDVLTANDVYVLGYPSSIGIQQVPQIDYTTPLLRKGIVAGINSSSRTIVLDCLMFQGNSGGPVLQVTHDNAFMSHFTVIGVISQYVPFTETWLNTTLSYANMQFHNSGYSIAEPMDAVLELIGK